MTISIRYNQESNEKTHEINSLIRTTYDRSLFIGPTKVNQIYYNLDKKGISKPSSLDTL